MGRLMHPHWRQLVGIGQKRCGERCREKRNLRDHSAGCSMRYVPTGLSTLASLMYGCAMAGALNTSRCHTVREGGVDWEEEEEEEMERLGKEQK